jgi:ABC-type transport system involved in multi-copper enzyme maturation permease subunit
MFSPLVLGLSAAQWIVIASFVAAILLALAWRFARQLGPATVTYVVVTTLLGLSGIILWQLTRLPPYFGGILHTTGSLTVTLAGMGAFLGFVEFGIMRLLGLLRLGAIARVTYYEALLQPFTLIILVAGILTIGVSARIGFFTYNEDFKMYRDVASSFVFLFTLPIMVFASTKVIDEEIENRTMLTLMSKPVSRTQVVIGKYVGVLVLVLVSVAILGAMAVVCSYLRYYDDMSIDYRIASATGAMQLELDNYKAFLAMLPSVALTFLQVASLAAISVAISTRFGLAVNVTVVAILYIAASIAKYVGGAPELPAAVRQAIGLLAYLLPGLGDLDLNQRLVFGDFALREGSRMPGQPTYAQIWQYVGLAGAYAVVYIGAVLSFGVGLFRSRELS